LEFRFVLFDSIEGKLFAASSYPGEDLEMPVALYISVGVFNIDKFELFLLL
jgi:hypothetical protein